MATRGGVNWHTQALMGIGNSALRPFVFTASRTWDVPTDLAVPYAAAEPLGFIRTEDDFVSEINNLWSTYTYGPNEAIVGSGEAVSTELIVTIGNRAYKGQVLPIYERQIHFPTFGTTRVTFGIKATLFLPSPPVDRYFSAIATLGSIPYMVAIRTRESHGLRRYFAGTSPVSVYDVLNARFV